jgi:ESS family glutamate:Na+ symporter
VNVNLIEPFTLHVVVAMLAVAVGWVLQTTLARLHPALSNVPLFPLTMIGGMLLQEVADRTGVAEWLDRGTFQRLTGLSLDLLVAAAVASMRLDLFFQNVVPFAMLMVAGIVWCVGTFIWLGPRMLSEDWFEQALVVYGTQTGVAADGLMLLRVADPHQRTTAAQAFAARSMVLAPLFGGGIVTATMPLMILQFGAGPMLTAASLLMAAAWFWPAGSQRGGPTTA